MTDDKALVERLRDEAAMIADDVFQSNPETLHDAADRIEQLEREKAIVSDLWEQQKEIALDYLADCNEAAHRIEALSAENERLRDNLLKASRTIQGYKDALAQVGGSDD